MLATKRGSVFALALLLLTTGLAAAQKKRKAVAETPPNPPSVSLSADAATITICPREEGGGGGRVRLTADARSPDGLPIRYAWRTTGGRIVGDGANTEWDLTDAVAGRSYVAEVTVTTGDARCEAFATIPVAVVECPPLREVCPNISIVGPDTVTVGQPITFSAEVNGGTPGATPVYNWTVEPGQITSGQGTPTITVSSASLGGRDVRAALTVNGYGGLNCTASFSTPVQTERRRPQQFDELGEVKRDDEKARLDIFASELQANPGAQGYIIIVGGRGNAAQTRAANAKTYLVTNRALEAGRIVTLVGRPGGETRMQLWLVPAGAEAPTVPQ
ncbi:MAG TPA: hypothetical protein VF546_10120 [Pyrinomonadaceae bacterium]|jgi:hypothetical protein